jgi:predicted MFS family arabinose efflux permease
MLKTSFQRYINNFRGFTREIWILTFITFINRAGTMVLPFLSKYLKEDLHFSYSQVGWIMVFFGSGSILGSWLGGKLSDKIGFYKIMIFSLFTTGVLLFCIQFITSFVGLCIGMFVLMIIADMFRPAMFVSIGAYAKPENRTRALTLVRLAINLGFAAGPALGGLIIMTIGYNGLFWIDGGTCIIAILFFWIKVKEKKKTAYSDKAHLGEVLTHSVFKDKPFWIFLFSCMVSGV